jgi:hypothetical protein
MTSSERRQLSFIEAAGVAKKGLAFHPKKSVYAVRGHFVCRSEEP